MSTTAEPQLCRVCGKPATSAACDAYRKYNIMTGGFDFSPGDYARYGCDEHPAESNDIDISTPLMDAMERLHAIRDEAEEE